jgi:hypothetical protein
MPSQDKLLYGKMESKHWPGERLIEWRHRETGLE